MNLNMKDNFNQIETLLDKNNEGKEINKSLELQKLIENGQMHDINIFLKKYSLPPQILNEAIIILLHKYKSDNYNFYEILRLLLQNGASPNMPIIYQDKQNNIRQEDKVTLLMFGIIKNDIDLINLILNFKPDIEQKDSFDRNAIIYAILYDNNDSTTIINILIKNNANINYYYNLQKNIVQYHSVLSLACCRNLVKIVKCLIDNNADINFKTKPEGDSCLHLAVKYDSPQLVDLLLFYAHINPEIINNKGKRPVDLIKPDENGQIIKSIFNNYYNKYNREYNENKVEEENNKGENLYINSINKENYKELKNEEGNNIISQISQFNQIKQMNFNMNDGNIYSQNMGINFNPPNINKDLEKNTIKNNYIFNYNNKNNLDLNNNNLKQNTNKDINNNLIEGKIENQNEKQKLENKYNKRNSISNSDIIRPKLSSYNNNNTKDNTNKNIHQVNSYKINLLKKSLYNGLHSNKRFKYNMEIPVEFNAQNKNKNSSNFKTMSNFISQSNTPILNIDLTNNSILKSEIKILELKEQLKLCKRNDELEVKMKQLNDDKILKEKDLREKIQTQYDLDNQIMKFEKTIKELKEKKKLLSERVIKYTNLKFNGPSPSEFHLYKTLAKDLNDYEKYINYKINKINPIIEQIINKIKIVVEEIIPEYELKVYGSYSHGLNLPESDINLVLINKNIIMNNYNNDNLKEDNITDIETTVGEKSVLSGNQNEKDENPITKEKNNSKIKNKNENDALSKLYNFFQNCDWIIKIGRNQVDNINFIDFIIDENLSTFEVNISLENENHNGLKIVKLAKKFMEEYHFLRPLYLALETILRKAGLNMQTNGGLSSYGLILMIISFIQKEKINFNSEEKDYILGKAFYEFLSNYGTKFDLNRYVEINYEIDDKKEKSKALNLGPIPQELTIIDPFNNKHNVAKSTFQYMNIKMAFIISKMVTQEVCECGCHFFRADHINNNYSIEHSYLKRMFNSVKRYNNNK